MQNKFTDGLRFILSCQATHDIYSSMSVENKLHFLAAFMSKHSSDNIMDIEIREILKLKLTEAPYASLSLFTMIQVDNEAFLTSTAAGRGIKP